MEQRKEQQDTANAVMMDRLMMDCLCAEKLFVSHIYQMWLLNKNKCVDK